MSKFQIDTWCDCGVDLIDPMISTIDIRDIARSLARMPRFTGHTVRTYCVAEHSFWVAKVLERSLRDMGAPNSRRVLAALLHDGAEAYTGDVSSPLKLAMRFLNPPGRDEIGSPFDEIERKLTTAVYVRYGVEQYLGDELVHAADDLMLHMEKEALMPPSRRQWSTNDRLATELLKAQSLDMADIIRRSVPRKSASVTSSWSSMLRHEGKDVDWECTFLLEFARLVGGAEAARNE